MKVTALLIAVAVGCVMAAPTTLHLKKAPNTFQPNTAPSPIRDRKSVGRALPMNGGILTLGAYFTSVSVGTGAGQQVFDAIVDTGSSNTAIPSVGCTECSTAALYNAAASPTSVPLSCGDAMCQNCAPTDVGSMDVPATANTTHCLYGRPQCDQNSEQCRFSISYGGSSSATAGTTVKDVACLGGNICGITYINQILEEFPVGTQPTGIVGFAYPANACNPTCQPTILDSLVAAGALRQEENLFGMCLTNADGGIIDLGAVNASRFFGSLMLTPIVSQQWFNIEVRDIEVGGASIGVPSFFYAIRNDAIGSFVDSGTGVVLVSPYVMQVLQQVFTSGSYATLPSVSALFSSQCVTLSNASMVDEYPDVSFVIAGVTGAADFKVTMSGKDYIMPSEYPVSPSTQYCLGIQGVPSIGVILGDIIMKRYYILFDRYANQLGFAPIRTCV